MNTPQAQANRKTEKRSRSFGCWHWALLIIGILLIAFLWLPNRSGGNTSGEPKVVLPPQGATQEPTSEELQRRREAERLQRQRELEERKLKEETERFKQDVSARLSRHLNRLEVLCNEFERSLPLKGAVSNFEAAREGVDFLASKEGLCGWKTSLSLAYKMAYDKLKGTHRTEEALDPLLTEHVTTHIQSAIVDYSNAFEKFKTTVLLEERFFASEILVRGIDFQKAVQSLTTLDETKLDAINQNISDFSSKFQELAKERSISIVGVTLEVVLAKATITATKDLVVRLLIPIFAKIIGKAIPTALTAGGLALADGPLPIGDALAAAVTVGFSVWTAYDLYNVTKVLPDALRNEMKPHIDGIEVELNNQALANVKELCRILKTDATTKVNSLLNETH